MKERPILFSAPMVRAILAGTKVQTRRVLKHCKCKITGAELAACEIAGEVNAGDYTNCPYGQPGNRLWVRETWMDLQGTGIERATGDLVRYAYAAATPPGSHGDERRKDYGLKWRPSIHMPRAASRITLEITGVRVERLQDIGAKDAIAEGVRVHEDHHGKPRGSIYSPVQAYRNLWESINGTGSWDANPWVWAVEFKRVESSAA